MKVFDLGLVPVFDKLPYEEQQAMKVLEEAAELLEAVKRHKFEKKINDEYTYCVRELTREAMLDEVADVIQACVNLLRVEGVTAEEWREAKHNNEDKHRQRGKIQ